jgi:hypothetical protein
MKFPSIYGAVRTNYQDCPAELEPNAMVLFSDMRTYLVQLVDKWESQKNPKESVSFRLAMKELKKAIYYEPQNP